MAQTISADGVQWPLETFIDAYGFTRVDALNIHHEHPLLGRFERLRAVTSGGELIPDRPARELPWNDVLAIRALDGGGLEVCDCCGTLEDVYFTGNGSWCDDCLSEGEVEP